MSSQSTSVSKKLLVRAAAESQVGNARGNNEDNVYFNGDFITPRTIRQEFSIKTGEYSDINCFAVLDGMGRNNTGSFASLLAATRLDEVADRIAFDTSTDTDDIVLDYINTANAEIRQQIRETGGVRTASTLALLIIENDTAHAYNAGDSRIYLFRDRQLVKLSRDHVSVSGQRSVALTQEGIRNGGLTKYLGMSEADGSLEPYKAKPFKIKKGDKFLICSDGISDFLDEEEIAACLARNRDPFGHTNELIDLALNSDSRDNVSCIVAEIVEPGLHITQNMLLTLGAFAIMTVGLLIGGVIGYIIGAGSVDKSTGFVDVSMITQQEAFTTTTTTQPTVAVSGSDTSGSDTGGTTNDDQSEGASTAITTKTLYPTTTYPTTTTAPYNVESFELSTHDFTMRLGKSQRIGYIVYPEELNLPTDAVHWKTSDESVCTVDAEGTVTAVGTGSCKITATIYGFTHEDDLIEECIVRVRKKK